MSNSTKFPEPNISLCFDTSSQDLHLCLKKGNDFFETTVITNSGHAQLVLLEIEELLSAQKLTISDVQLIVCAAGPGSFTGLRIGLATAKGLALGNACPYIGVNTLDAWALHCVPREGTVLSVIDARKNKFYGAFYQDGCRTSAYLDESVDNFVSLMPKSGKIRVTGPHCIQFLSELDFMQACSADEKPSMNPARAMLLLGLAEYEKRGTQADSFGPLYIRKSDAELTLRL